MTLKNIRHNNQRKIMRNHPILIQSLLSIKLKKMMKKLKYLGKNSLKKTKKIAK